MYLCEARVGGNYTVEKINRPLQVKFILAAFCGEWGASAAPALVPRGRR